MGQKKEHLLRRTRATSSWHSSQNSSHHGKMISLRSLPANCSCSLTNPASRTVRGDIQWCSSIRHLEVRFGRTRRQAGLACIVCRRLASLGGHIRHQDDLQPGHGNFDLTIITVCELSWRKATQRHLVPEFGKVDLLQPEQR